MSPTPGAGPSLSRRSSGSSESTTFATPPSSPKLNTSVSRIPKLASSPVPFAADNHAYALASSSSSKSSAGDKTSVSPNPAPHYHFPAAPSTSSSLPVPVHNKLLARKSMSAAIPASPSSSSKRASAFVAKYGPSPSTPTSIPVFRGGGGASGYAAAGPSTSSSSSNVSNSVTPTPGSAASTVRGAIGRGASPAATASAMRRSSSAEGGKRSARSRMEGERGLAPPMPAHPQLPPGAAPPGSGSGVAGTGMSSSSGIPRRQKSSSSLGRRKSHIPTSTNTTPSPRARPMSVKPPARGSSAAASAALSAAHHPPLPTASSSSSSSSIPNGSNGNRSNHHHHIGFPPNGGLAVGSQPLPLRNTSLRANTESSRPSSPPAPTPPRIADGTFRPPDAQFRRPDATHSPGQPSTSSVDVDDGHRHVDDHSPARPNGVAGGQSRPSRSSSLSSASIPHSPLARRYDFQSASEFGAQAAPPPPPQEEQQQQQQQAPPPRSPQPPPISPRSLVSPALSSGSTSRLSVYAAREAAPSSPIPPALATSPTRSSSLAPESVPIPPPATSPAASSSTLAPESVQTLRSSTSSQGSTTTVVPEPIEIEVPPLPPSNPTTASSVSTVSSSAAPDGQPEADTSRRRRRSSIKSPVSPRAPRTSPRPDRKSPGLTIDPPPPPSSSHNISVLSPPIPLPQPSAVPIIPAKSPLRPRTGRLRAGTNAPPVPKLPDDIPPVPQRPSSVAHVASSTAELPESGPSAPAAGQPPPTDLSGATARAEEANQTTASATEEPSAATTASSTSSEPPLLSPSVVVPSQQALAAAILAPVQNTYGGIPLSSRSDPAHSPAVATAAESSASAAQPFPHQDLSSLLASPIPFDDSGPPSAPASNQNIWVVSSAAGGAASRPTSFLDASTSTASTISTSVSTTDSLLGRSEASMMDDAAIYDKRESLDDEVIVTGSALSQHHDCDICPSPTNCPHMLKKQTSLSRVTPLNLDVHSKLLPELPPPSPNQPLSPRTPTTPARPQHAQQTAPPPRSPSMPTLVRKDSPSSVASQPTTESHDHLVPRPRMRGAGPDGRSNTTGHSPRPQSMVITGSPLPSPVSPNLSRRAHLIREIAHTERAHATDLALITDAYVGRVLRSDSGVSQSSTTVEADSNASTPGGAGAGEHARGHARRPSYGLPDEHGHANGKRHQHERRMSGQQESGWSNVLHGFMSPTLKSPREKDGHQGNGSMDGMYQSSAGGSASSFQIISTPGQSHSATPVSASTNNGFTRLGGVMNPQSGKPLSSWDIKAVFLNISELASISDELATEFDKAMGENESDPGTPGGDSGTDKLGDVFMKMLPRLRPLYTFYCSRQAVASKRLLELQQDPGYAFYLNDCWSQVKSHTHAWNLDSMLIKPVQRITKYPLLFEDLLACTTPSHPDYHAIQKAAEGARSLALEIDEAKRRKDVISSVMSKSQSTVSLVKDPKAGPGGRLLNLRRFKRDKMNGGDSGPPDVTPYAQAQLKELVAKLENGDKQVRRLNGEVVNWVNANRVLLQNGLDTNLDMLRWYTLNGEDKRDVRAVKVAAYQEALKTCHNTIWRDMQERINSSVLVVLGKMADAARNPLAIIDRLNRKSADYARYMAHRHAKKSIDRLMIQEATDYVAIHTQLLEELPVFLEGYQKIFEIAVSALTLTQTRYYASLRDITTAFTTNFLTPPTEGRLTATGEIEEFPINIKTARGIHKAWLDKFLAPNNIVKSLLTTSADFMKHSEGTSESRKGPSSRSTSRSDVRSPNLRHAPSFITSRPKSRNGTESRNGHRSESRTEQLRSESRAEHISDGSAFNVSDSGDERANRRRSRSLSGQSTAVSDSESSSRFASLMRRNSQRNGSSSKQRSQRNLRPPMPDGFMADRKTNENTLSVATSEDRLSQHTQQSQQSQQSQDSQNSKLSQDVPLSMSPQSHVSQLEQTMPADSTAEEIASRLSFGLPRIHTESTPLLFGDFGALAKPSPVYRVMADDVQTQSPVEMTPSDLGQSATTASSPRSSVTDVENGDPWTGSGISYTCIVVAEFNPKELGDAKFMGMHFLPLYIGQEVEVRHEIGRVANLTNFPYASLGVENDGAVVCRAPDGSYGVAMCSFLEPIDITQPNI